MYFQDQVFVWGFLSFLESVLREALLQLCY